jgi:hypothetical protein
VRGDGAVQVEDRRGADQVDDRRRRGVVPAHRLILVGGDQVSADPLLS